MCCVNLIYQTAQDVLIYLFGETAVHLTVEGLGSVTVQELGRIVREALHIPESAHDAFALWLCSPLLGNKSFSVPFLHLSVLCVIIWTPLLFAKLHNLNLFI